MADILDQTIGDPAERKHEKTIGLQPTLFIGIGGTGGEVLLRLRRRILNTLWGGRGSRTRIESLADFPVAQFIHFDLDTRVGAESDKAQADDLQSELVRFSDEEKIVEKFDIEKYCRDDEALEKYQHIKEWMPLTPKKIRELNFDPAKGAAQNRSISRLYLFDKYTRVRDKIRLKLKSLKAGLSHDPRLRQLGLRMETEKFRVVVVCSVAGGTGSGAFIDFGLIARWLAKSGVGNADVELMLFLPTGYAGANKVRTEANAYAALMELESAMLGKRESVGRWDKYDQPELPREPYNEVYLIDTGNLAQQHTSDIQDVYHMVADALFEDFASSDFANRKRSIGVNQSTWKNSLYEALVPKNRFGDMRLTYSKRFSSFGQAVLDTRQEARLDARAHRWAEAMLRAFFGVGSTAGVNRATDKQRDEFMAAQMALRVTPFSDFPHFSDKTIELKRSSGEFIDYVVVDDLLQDRQGLLLAGIEQRVNARIEEIRTGFARAEWPAQVRDAVRQLERDAVRDQDTAADTTEDRVAKRRAEMFEHIKATMRDQLYVYLDNKDFGGLEYVLSLVEQVKDRLAAPGIGLIAALQTNAHRYREIKEAVGGKEFERLLSNLGQTRGGLVLFGSGEKQANTVMDHLRSEIANALKFHLRAKAADEAATLMTDLSNWLGRKTGVDAHGAPVWSGLVGELQAGREAVLDMLAQLQRSNTILQDELKKDHATLIAIAASEREIVSPAGGQLRTWAEEAFRDLGGSKVLFPMLQDPARRGEIVAKVKRMAERQLSSAAGEPGEGVAEDPLLEALSQMGPAERMERFRKLLACAMPWIDANLAGDFAVDADQFKCYLGVAGAERFRRQFGAELGMVIPACITPAQFFIVETGIPGRAVCYCEFSGFPMTVLRGMEAWRASYRMEPGKNPTHTHIDTTQFSHPMAPTTDEINRLAEDFKQFLLAVMLGVLTRWPQRHVPFGQYQFAVAQGDVRRIGNEWQVRQNGLGPGFRAAIVERVQESLASLGATQTAAISVLASYYETSVYTPRLVETAGGAQDEQKGFPSTIAAEIKQEMHDKARRKGLTEATLVQLGSRLRERLDEWASVIPESDEDAFEWEVREPDEDGHPRLKYMVRPEMLKEGWLDALLHAGMPGAPAVAAGAVAPPPLPATPPPLPGATHPSPVAAMAEFQYYLGVDGKQLGPCGALQVAQMVQAGLLVPAHTKVWRPGLPDWSELGQLSELAPWLQIPPSPATPPPLG